MRPETWDAHHLNTITSTSGLYLQNMPTIPALLPTFHCGLTLILPCCSLKPSSSVPLPSQYI